MKKYYAWIINWETGRGFEIGAWSMENLRADLERIHKTGFADLEKCSVRIYTANC